MLNTLLSSKTTKIILDLGCGRTYDNFGSPLCEQKKYYKNIGYIGLDISKNKIEKLRNKFKRKKQMVFEVFDIIKNPLPLENNSTDEIHCHMLQPNINIQQPKGFEIKLFDEVYRILKINGAFHFSCDFSFFNSNYKNVINEDYESVIQELQNIFGDINIRLNLGIDEEDKFKGEIEEELKNYTHYPQHTRLYVICEKKK